MEQKKKKGGGFPKNPRSVDRAGIGIWEYQECQFFWAQYTQIQKYHFFSYSHMVDDNMGKGQG